MASLKVKYLFLFVVSLKPSHKVKIGLVGKYVELKDSYKSIAESFDHAGAQNNTDVQVEWIHSEEVRPDTVEDLLSGLDGILVAPGFGSRGIDGKITAIKYARENKVPFLGICLGMQCAVVEFARNVLGLEQANSTEFKQYTEAPVISLMSEQKSVTNMGGTMRLGAYPCALQANSNARAAYSEDLVEERHRHRFEFNNDYLHEFETNGMIATGINPDSGLVEIVEVVDHPWFVGCQFHPEYSSTVLNPHPLFLSFVKTVRDLKEGTEKKKDESKAKAETVD